jgi:hypothetical protein
VHLCNVTSRGSPADPQARLLHPAYDICSPMPPLPPYDRTIALACSMRTLRHRVLNLRCKCGWSSPQPIQVLLRDGQVHPDQTLADALVMARCGGRCTMSATRQPMTIHLCKTTYGPTRPDQKPQHRRPSWEILLHDGIGDEPPAAAKAVE